MIGVDTWKCFAKLNGRYEKMNSRIVAWENEKKRKAKLDMDRKEVQPIHARKLDFPFFMQKVKSNQNFLLKWSSILLISHYHFCFPNFFFLVKQTLVSEFQLSEN